MKSSFQFSDLSPPRDSYEPADYTSREGALVLKSKIEGYWAERGQSVMLALQNVGFHPAIRAARYDVRSDMINGLPRQSGKPKAANDDGPALSLVEAESDDLDVDDLYLD